MNYRVFSQICKEWRMTNLKPSNHKKSASADFLKYKSTTANQIPITKKRFSFINFQ